MGCCSKTKELLCTYAWLNDKISCPYKCSIPDNSIFVIEYSKQTTELDSNNCIKPEFFPIINIGETLSYTDKTAFINGSWTGIVISVPPYMDIEVTLIYKIKSRQIIKTRNQCQEGSSGDKNCKATFDDGSTYTYDSSTKVATYVINIYNKNNVNNLLQSYKVLNARQTTSNIELLEVHIKRTA